jgi:hypothetical protein
VSRTFWRVVIVAVVFGIAGAADTYADHWGGWLGNGISAFACVLIGASMAPSDSWRRKGRD